MSRRATAATARTIAFALAWLVASAPGEARADERPERTSFDYLYIDANANSASGGHAAVRLGDDVFHYQYRDGLLVLHRDEWLEFQLTYRGLQNRNIQLTRLDVSVDTAERLQREFRQQHLAGLRQLALLSDAREDLRLAARLASASPAEVSVPAVGFFHPPHGFLHWPQILLHPPHGILYPPDESSAGTSRGLSQLASEIARRHGPGFLAERRAAVERMIEQLDAQPVAMQPADFRPGAFPTPHYSFHQRYRDLLAARHALDVIEQAPALRTEAVALPEGPELRREDAQRLERARSALSLRLVDLAASKRPDWGPALLLGMARMESISASLARGRWLLLDTMPPDADRLAVGGRRREVIGALEHQAASDWAEARAQWLAQPRAWSERDFARLEESATRWAELRHARAGAEVLRVHAGRMIPGGVGTVAGPPVPGALRQNTAAALGALERQALHAESWIEAEQSYQLIGHNCVTELFATVDRMLARSLPAESGLPRLRALAEQEAARFGGVLPRATGPGIIPFVSSDRVRANWRVLTTAELPSLRRLQLQRLRRSEPPAWVALRESNTVTSTLYRLGLDDSLFLFFSDDTLLLRPVVGALNVLTGVVGAGFGTAALPFDRGRRLDAALRGVLFSVPELLFQNIRKGTHDWISPELRTLLQN